jgi:hypothetical protein
MRKLRGYNVDGVCMVEKIFKLQVHGGFSVGKLG